MKHSNLKDPRLHLRNTGLLTSSHQLVFGVETNTVKLCLIELERMTSIQF